MAIWQYILILLNAICVAYLGSIEFIEKDSFGDSKYLKIFAVFTFDNKFWLAIILGFIVTMFSSILILFEPRKIRSEFRESLMDGVFEQILDNDKTKARITIFKDAGIIKSSWYRMWDFAGLLKRRHGLRYVLKYCWKARYIRIYKRWGTDHKKSRTYFCFDPETAQNCQGIAGQVRQREEVIVVSLPDISGLNLATETEANPLISEYMRSGYIKDYRTIQGLNRHSKFIYGNIISVAGGKKKLVLVIDSCAEKDPFQRTALKLLSTYVKQISASFGS